MTHEISTTAAEEGTVNSRDYKVISQTLFISSISLSSISTTKDLAGAEMSDVKGAGDVRSDVRRSRDVDGGWAWVVLVTSCVSLAIQEMFFGVSGMFQVEFQSTFGGSRGFLALIGSIFITCTGMLGPLSGALSTQLTPRITLMLGGAIISVGHVAASFAPSPTALLLTYGVLGGIGNALIFTPAVTSFSGYFVRLRQMANGLIMASSGIGSLLGPYLARWFIDTHGWRFSLAACGCVTAQVCVLGALVFPPSGSRGLHSVCRTCPGNCLGRRGGDGSGERSRRVTSLINGGKETVSKSLLGGKDGKNGDDKRDRKVKEEEGKADSFKHRVCRVVGRKEVWILCVNQMLLMTGYNMNLLHQPSYIVSVGLGGHHFPNLYLAFGLSMMFIRIVGGFVFTRFENQLIPAIFLSELTMALTLGLLPVYGVTLPALFVTNVLTGLSFGVAFMLSTPVLITYIGVDLLPLAYGLMLMCCGSASIFTVSFAGLLYDLLGNYKASFYLAGSMVLTGALALLLLFFVKRNKREGRDIKGR